MVFPLVVFGLIAGVALLSVAHKKMKRTGGLRLLMQGPQPIASLEEGQKARIRGRVEAIETISAPFSGKPCVCFDLRIDVKKFVGKSWRWVTVHTQHEGRDFLLTDAEGSTALIDGLVLEFSLRQDGGGRTSLFGNDDNVIAFAQAHGVSTHGFLQKRSIRIREGVLMEGEQATITGEASWEIDPKGDVTTSGYRDTERQKRVRITGLGGGPVFISEG